MRTCPQCATDNPDDRITCASCGRPLPSAPEAKDEEAGPIGSLPEGPVRLGEDRAESSEVRRAEDTGIPPIADETSLPREEQAEAHAAPPPPVYMDREEAHVPPPPPGMSSYTVTGAETTTPSATWALVTGIASIPCCGLPGLGLGIAAIFLANHALRESPANESMARAGKVCGIIGIVLSALGMLALIVVMVARFN